MSTNDKAATVKAATNTSAANTATAVAAALAKATQVADQVVKAKSPNSTLVSAAPKSSAKETTEVATKPVKTEPANKVAAKPATLTKEDVQAIVRSCLAESEPKLGVEDSGVIPTKKKCDFSVEFLDSEKKRLLDRSENVGMYYVSKLSFMEINPSAEEGRRRKRKKKVESDTFWSVHVVFVDDLNNESADFVDILRALDGPFRMRVKSLDPSGNVTEIFLLKDCVVTTWPSLYTFNVEESNSRNLTLDIRASSILRKSKIPEGE